jgi:protein gp37
VPEWNGPRRQAAASTLKQPFAWNRKAQRTSTTPRVFLNPESDFFDNQVPAEWRAESWDMIHQCCALIFIILTKRPQNILKMLAPDWGTGWPHVWIGVSVENMTEARRRIPVLLKVPCKTRLLSCEPLLESLDLTPWLATGDLHWVIVGGETDAAPRPTCPDCMRDIRDQCVWLAVALFVKQMTGGERVPIPADLQIREYPNE